MKKKRIVHLRGQPELIKKIKAVIVPVNIPLFFSVIIPYCARQLLFYSTPNRPTQTHTAHPSSPRRLSTLHTSKTYLQIDDITLQPFCLSLWTRFFSLILSVEKTAPPVG